MPVTHPKSGMKDQEKVNSVEFELPSIRCPEVPARRLPIGAEPIEGGVTFRVWAPKCRRVQVVLLPHAPLTESRQEVELFAEGNGYFSVAAPNAVAGMLYGFRLNGGERLYPDPASRYQPQGPHGLSQIVDSTAFEWSDQNWHGLQAAGQVLYEMHIGTFTPEGTWAAAGLQLPNLAAAGMTVLEIMPIADFPGQFGWGYDGVNLFAPTRLYGQPDDFRHFVDRAHRAELGVILDVVYNHFGAVENYVGEFSDDYFTDRYKNEWGAAVNFDGANAAPVREFFLANARYWIEEFHLDGFRFDATQSIWDTSQEHILQALTREARRAAKNRLVYLAAENEPQDVRMVRSHQEGGYGFDALWNDDFHHSARVRLTGRREAYFSDYRGSAPEFAAVAKRGFIYEGQPSQWQGVARGTPTTGLSATSLINFLENHDQIANSLRGERIHQLTSPGRWRAMTAFWLLAPQTPLFFQGQEYCADTPFLYFADCNGAAGQLAAQGRAKFLAQFPSLATPDAQGHLSAPSNPRTFERCKLNPLERSLHPHASALHTDLLQLRRDDPLVRPERGDQLDATTLSLECLLVRSFCRGGTDKLLLVNFGSDLNFSPAPEPLLAPPLESVWELQWTSESVRYGGRGIAPPQSRDGWHLPAESAMLFRSVRPKDAKSNGAPSAEGA